MFTRFIAGTCCGSRLLLPMACFSWRVRSFRYSESPGFKHQPYLTPSSGVHPLIKTVVSRRCPGPERSACVLTLKPLIPAFHRPPQDALNRILWLATQLHGSIMDRNSEPPQTPAPKRPLVHPASLRMFSYRGDTQSRTALAARTTQSWHPALCAAAVLTGRQASASNRGSLGSLASPRASDAITLSTRPPV